MDERIGDLLDGTLRKMGVRGKVREAQLREVFAECVGAALQPMCQALRLEGSTLVVGTTNTALAQQLHLDSPRLIAAVNASLGAAVVRRLRFVGLGSGPGAAQG